ncbi:hypothetical protein C0J52_19172, partial [Blattella germanica]
EDFHRFQRIPGRFQKNLLVHYQKDLEIHFLRDLRWNPADRFFLVRFQRDLHYSQMSPVGHYQAFLVRCQSYHAVDYLQRNPVGQSDRLVHSPRVHGGDDKQQCSNVSESKVLLTNSRDGICFIFYSWLQI